MDHPVEGRNNIKKRAEAEAKVASMSWQEKKELAQKEEDVLRKDIEDLKTWADLIETMNDEQLKGYLENHPAGGLKMTKDKKMKKKVPTGGKSKSSTSNGIMASVWRFDKK